MSRCINDIDAVFELRCVWPNSKDDITTTKHRQLRMPGWGCMYRCPGSEYKYIPGWGCICEIRRVF